MSCGEKFQWPIMVTVRIRTLWVRILIAIASVNGCTWKQKIPADTVVVALAAQPTTLDPRYASDANSTRINQLLFNSLVYVGPELKPVPDAAESWTAKDRTYRFRLRSNLRFHNGRSVSLEDVEFSFATFRASGSPFAGDLRIIDHVKVVQVKEHLEVELRLKYNSPRFLTVDLPTVKILPRNEVLQAGPDFGKYPIGTGGFKFVRQDWNHIYLDSVSAKIPHLVFKVVADDYTRFQKMWKGEVDIAQMELPQNKIAEFQKHPDRFQVFVYPGLSMNYLLINFKDPILRRREVRQALAQTLKREEIIQYKMNGLAREATSILTPINPYFFNGLINPGFNPESARKKIESLGLTGQKLILKTSNSPQVIDNALVLANQLQASGLDVQLQSYEWGTFYADIKKGKFQLASMKWVGSVDPDIYRAAFHSSEAPPGRNRGSYNSPEIDRLIELADQQSDYEKRRQLYTQVQKAVHEDLAVLPLWYEEQVAVAQKNVLNYQPTPTGDFRPLLKVNKSGLGSP